MSHEVLITRRQSIFHSFAYPGRGGPQKAGAGWCWGGWMLRPTSAWICKEINNALSSGYQDPMGHLILTTSPWSVLTWITLPDMVTVAQKFEKKTTAHPLPSKIWKKIKLASSALREIFCSKASTEASVMKCTYRNFCTPHYRKFLRKADETSLCVKNWFLDISGGIYFSLN